MHTISHIRDLISNTERSTTSASLAMTVILFVACIALLGAKALLIFRININWDEFYFLTHIHQGARGELTLFLQGAYTHAFRWLVAVGNDEIGQILVGRGVMWALLLITAVLIWKLAARWVPGPLALLAPLCYLSMSPIVKHGASFRSDSLLAPLTVLTLLLLARPGFTRKAAIGAGICIGMGAAINIKMALMLPLFICFICLNRDSTGQWAARNTLTDLLTIGVTSALTLTTLLLMHKASLAPSTVDPAYSPQAAFAKVFLEVPFFPRKEHYEHIRYMNSIAWLLIYAGAVCALFRREFRSASIVLLALAPILIYRNAWPYYYVIMLAPVCILVPIAVRSIQLFVQPLERFKAPYFVTPLVALLLSLNGYGHVSSLSTDGQAAQRAVVTAVHRIFPEPVPYIDHSGMIASFPKVNFFMSTWGIENYRAIGKSFMDAAIERRAPLLLVNRPVLDPKGSTFSRLLLPRDQELIQKFYIPYWGPIYIAGVSATIRQDENSLVHVPFPGKYRLRSDTPIVVNDSLAKDGDVLAFDRTQASVRAAAESATEAHATLLWADVGDPPPEAPPHGALYSRL